jgi:hypothetical protein
MTTERQGWGDIREGHGAPILRVLAERRGRPTIVRMANGEELTIDDGTGWGRDYGDNWEHVIAETTPPGAGPSLFYLSEVECLMDPETREVLISQIPAPGET